jgi:hypothetical protein
MGKHAMLSASGASRWLACPPSALYEREFPESQSSYADEGTLAHELATILIGQKGWGINMDGPIKRIKEHELYSDEMMEYIDTYAEFVVNRFRDAPEGAILCLEQLVSLETYIPKGYGTVDVGIPANRVLEVIDLKYGKGVPVHAEENPQAMTYALGLLDEYDLLYDIQLVRITIYQPRIDNVSTYEITAKNLKRWGYEVLKAGALKATVGEGEYVAGDHCRFCRARSMCKTAATYNLQLATRDFAPPQNVTDDQVVKILKRAASMKQWIKAVEEKALEMAVMQGKKWPGMKVVQGRSVRKYTDQGAIIENLKKAGIPEEEVVNKKLLGITEMSKKLTTLQFQQLVEPHVIKPPGKPTLVDESDKRPEFNSSEAAALDFASGEDD